MKSDGVVPTPTVSCRSGQVAIPSDGASNIAATTAEMKSSPLPCCAVTAGLNLSELTANNPKLPFVPQPNLEENLKEAKLWGPSGDFPVGSLQGRFVEFLRRNTTPGSVYLVHSSEGGATEVKTEQMREARKVLLGVGEGEHADLSHLMCFVGEESEFDENASDGVRREAKFASVLKPALSKVPPAGGLMVATRDAIGGHLVLSPPALRNFVGTFEYLGEETLESDFEVVRHSSNFLLNPQRFKGDRDVLFWFDPAIARSVLSTDKPEIHLVEVPLGDRGDKWSAVVETGTLLAFLTEVERDVPQTSSKNNRVRVRIEGYESLGMDRVSEAMNAMQKLFSHDGLEKSLRFEGATKGKRSEVVEVRTFPHSAPTAGRVVQVRNCLAQRLVEAAPYMPPAIAKAAATSFVGHYCNVEQRLIKAALDATHNRESRERIVAALVSEGIEGCELIRVDSSEDLVADIFQRLKGTEFARYLVPMDSLEEFKRDLNERGKQQINHGLTFSNVTAKSEEYLASLATLGEGLGEVVSAVASGREEGTVTWSSTFKVLKRLLAESLTVSAGITPAGAESTVNDFIELVFARQIFLVQKLENEIFARWCPNGLEDSNSRAAFYFSQSMSRAEKVLAQYDLPPTSELRHQIIERAVQPLITIFYDQPFIDSLFGPREDFSKRVVRDVIARASAPV